MELHAGRGQRLRERHAADPVMVLRVDLAQLRLRARPFRVAASPPYGHSTELVRRLPASDRMISADLVLRRAAARWLAIRSDTSRSARRYRLELGPALPQRAVTAPCGLGGTANPPRIIRPARTKMSGWTSH